MPFFRRHLDAAELGLAVLDTCGGRIAAHLESCVQCRRRRDRLAVRLGASRAAARAAADAAFSAADLSHQRQTILQRIRRMGAGARVLPFPGAAPDVPRAPSYVHDRRWIAAAAAAGLLLGIAVGRQPFQWAPPQVVATNGSAVVVAVEPIPSDARRDDMLLSDVEEALTREIRPEFEALDGLTPIAYEVR